MKLTRYQLSLLALLSLAQALAFIDRVNMSVVVPHLIKDHGYTPASAGVLLSIFNFSYMFAILLAGPLTDRIKPKRALPLAIVVWSGATALCGLTTKFLPLAFCRALVGFGESPVVPSGSRIIKESFEPAQRSGAVSVFFAGNKVGLALGIPMAAAILSTFGRPWVFYVPGILAIFWLICWQLVYRPPPLEVATDPKLERIRWVTLLRFRATWGMILGTCGYLYVYYVFASWLPGYLVLQRKLPIMQSGFLSMLPFASGIACTLLGGWLGDRLIMRGVSLTLVRKSFAVSGIFGATVCTVIGALSTETWLAVTFLTLAVMSLSFATASVNAIPIDLAPPHKVAAYVSLQAFGGNVGGALAPLVTGALVSSSGSFITPLLVTAGVGLVLGCGGIGLVIPSIRRLGLSDLPAPALRPAHP